LIYTNLLLFLVAIFIFSTASVPDVPLLPPPMALAVAALLFFCFNLLARRFFGRGSAQLGSYFKTEKLLSIVALVFFALTVYLCDPRYYLEKLSLGQTVPSLVNFAGLLIFVAYLAVMWRAGMKRYGRLFGREQTFWPFVLSNIRTNLPIVLPWIVLSLLYDLIILLPIPGLQELTASRWGDLLFFALFLLFVLLFFPPLVRNLWGCKKLPEGYLKDHLDEFCAARNFTADFYLWPLLEGRVVTAGVMGIVPGLRYILLTPALIESMSMAELEAVIAHEIGHVKKRHLLLYIMLIGGFSLLATMLAQPASFLLLSKEFVSRLVFTSGITVETAISIATVLPLLVFMLVYFRFIFGYFIRNFERQADLYSLSSMGNPDALVSAFEKIAVISGSDRDQPNWHHFGIGQRVDCLQQAEKEPQRITAHDKKVRYSLLLYLCTVLLILAAVNQIPTEALIQRYQENIVEIALVEKTQQEPENALWQKRIGDFMLFKKREKEALIAYEKAYSLDPSDPEIMNNFAWLMLTANRPELRDPERALTLARVAAAIRPEGYILDTLATASWANGLVDEAVNLERQAAAVDPENSQFYMRQIKKFTSQSYSDSLDDQQLSSGAGKI
jgi:Zn-dependent protease with chaperone function